MSEHYYGYALRDLETSVRKGLTGIRDEQARQTDAVKDMTAAMRELTATIAKAAEPLAEAARSVPDIASAISDIPDPREGLSDVAVAIECLVPHDGPRWWPFRRRYTRPELESEVSA
jgi:hypothetical protein